MSVFPRYFLPNHTPPPAMRAGGKPRVRVGDSGDVDEAVRRERALGRGGPKRSWEGTQPPPELRPGYPNLEQCLAHAGNR